MGKIIITGAAGFIGSCLVEKLNEEGLHDLILVDDFTKIEKKENLKGKFFLAKIERSDFFNWLNENNTEIDFIFHIGARTDTTEFDKKIFDELNVDYSKKIWEFSSEFQVPLVYASSAATYGLGEYGYEDNHEVVPKLKPLNPYGDSKNDFDKWALEQQNQPPFWAGLKFFNVYGPNEYHKGRMASVIFHAFHQISVNNRMKLFRSHNPNYKAGGQLRDFIYDKDLINVCFFLLKSQPESGIYNLGSGTARTFNDLAISTFNALNKTTEIDFIDTPLDIRDKYQYFTEANMSKLKNSGYQDEFYSLEKGVFDYVTNYLLPNKHY